MASGKWSVKKFAIVGAFCGAIYSFFNGAFLILGQDFSQMGSAVFNMLLAEALGGAIGGAFAGSIIAFIKNYFVK